MKYTSLFYSCFCCCVYWRSIRVIIWLWQHSPLIPLVGGWTLVLLHNKMWMGNIWPGYVTRLGQKCGALVWSCSALLEVLIRSCHLDIKTLMCNLLLPPTDKQDLVVPVEGLAADGLAKVLLLGDLSRLDWLKLFLCSLMHKCWRVNNSHDFGGISLPWFHWIHITHIRTTRWDWRTWLPWWKRKATL